jgi:hypothetical protein
LLVPELHEKDLIRPSLEHFSRRCAGAAGHFFVIPAGESAFCLRRHTLYLTCRKNALSFEEAIALALKRP